MITLKVEAEASRSNRRKRNRKKKTRAKVEDKVNCINLIDCVDDRLQSVMTYIYIGSKT
jgi:hypothetical protein